MNCYRFATIWMLLFAILFVALSLSGIAPKNILLMNKEVMAFLTFMESVSANETAPRVVQMEADASALESDLSINGGILPERIGIEKIGVSSPVANPKTADNRVLDEELEKGVVRYPGSGYLNENSNIFLFGHSTSLTNVRNKAYRAFNDLDKLNIGDVITIYAKGEVYEYRVISVSLTKAEEALVAFSTGKKLLTLSTCNTFGKKEDRFVVKAEFVRQLMSVNNK